MTIDEYARAIVKATLATVDRVDRWATVDDIIASVPAPDVCDWPGCGAVAVKGNRRCGPHFKTPAPDVQAQDANLIARLRNRVRVSPYELLAEVEKGDIETACARLADVQAQIDAAVAREREGWERRVEAALEDYYGRTFYAEYQRLECALAALHALVEDRARSGAKKG